MWETLQNLPQYIQYKEIVKQRSREYREKNKDRANEKRRNDIKT